MNENLNTLFIIKNCGALPVHRASSHLGLFLYCYRCQSLVKKSYAYRQLKQISFTNVPEKRIQRCEMNV